MTHGAEDEAGDEEPRSETQEAMSEEKQTKTSVPPRDGDGGAVVEPWYRTPAILISVTALVFSIATTAVSAVRTLRQDRRDRHAELRALILRIAAIPRERFEIWGKYGDKNPVALAITSSLTQEQAVLSKQASDVIEILDDDAAATEYLAVATGLIDTGLLAQAQKMLEGAVRASRDAPNEVAALRSLGSLLFRVGDATSARQRYQQAIAAYDKYPDQSRAYVASDRAFTYLGLAISERLSNNCMEAKEAVRRADEEAKKVPNVPVKGAGDLHAQIAEFKALVESKDGCGPGAQPFPSFGPVVPIVTVPTTVPSPIAAPQSAPTATTSP